MIENNIAHLYKITHIPTGQFYYGKKNGTQQNGYWGSGIRIKNLINKHPKSEFKYEILVISTVEYIFDLEKKIVNEDLLKEELCLNLAVGGFGTGHLNKQHRAKLSKIYSKRKRTEYSKKKTSETLKEYYKNHKQVITPEAIAKMKETKAKNPTGTGRWMNNGSLQKKVKLELIDKYVSEGWDFGILGKHITKEYKEKLKQASLNQWARQKGLQQ